MRKKILMALTLGVFWTATAFGGLIGDLGLDTSASYDIYLGSPEGGSSVIKNVQVTDTRTVNNMVFLVVNSVGGFTKHSEGLVRLDFVQAILPTFSSQPLQKAP